MSRYVWILYLIVICSCSTRKISQVSVSDSTYTTHRTDTIVSIPRLSVKKYIADSTLLHMLEGQIQEVEDSTGTIKATLTKNKGGYTLSAIKAPQKIILQNTTITITKNKNTIVTHTLEKKERSFIYILMQNMRYLFYTLLLLLLLYIGYRIYKL